jgi:hypothetical protein
VKLPLEAILLGERRREEYGDIAGLAASIEKYGLLHPIVVDDAGTLIAGERRLRAVQSLGWESVDVRDLGELSDAERAEIELEENLQRKDLTPHERSKTLVKLAETARRVLSERAELRTDSVRNGPGRPKEAGSLRDVAERIGEPPMNIVKAQQHVEIAEQIPVLAGPEVKQYHALEAREKLDKIPEPERPKAVALVNQPGVPPKDAVEILGNLAAMPAPERERVLALAESADTRDRSDALTEAWKRPPMPDGRIPLLMDAVAALKKALRMFQDDPMNDHLILACDTVKDVLSALKEYHRDA